MFQKMLQIIFESIPGQKIVLEVLKRGIFLILHFGEQPHEGGGATAPGLPGYTTVV